MRLPVTTKGNNYVSMPYTHTTQITHIYSIYTVGCLFLRATNFADFMDFQTAMKFFSPKIIGNPIVTQIAD